jgi:RNA recognition motif-containing protein
MTSTLFVGDLSSDCATDDLEKVFSEFGEIVDVRIATDSHSGQSLLYGFVEFNKLENAEKALLTMNGKILRGRPLR